MNSPQPPIRTLGFPSNRWIIRPIGNSTTPTHGKLASMLDADRGRRTWPGVFSLDSVSSSSSWSSTSSFHVVSRRGTSQLMEGARRDWKTSIHGSSRDHVMRIDACSLLEMWESGFIPKRPAKVYLEAPCIYVSIKSKKLMAIGLLLINNKEQSVIITSCVVSISIDYINCIYRPSTQNENSPFISRSSNAFYILYIWK